MFQRNLNHGRAKLPGERAKNGRDSILDSGTYPFSYIYNLRGGRKSVTYPAQRVVSYSGRGNVVSAGAYASADTYAPHGGQSGLLLGNGVQETTAFDRKLRWAGVVASKRSAPAVESPYFGGALGRFTSPDGPLVDQNVSDPQSWNLYGDVRNNPLALIDLSGLCSKQAKSYYDDDGHKTFLFKGICSGKTIGGEGQAVDVRDKQGSLWELLTVTIPRHVENDRTLNRGAQQLFRELGKRIDSYPTVCGGRWYSYAGKELELGSASGFVGVITEHDSRAGKSKGALLEGGYGEGIVGGVGYVGSTTGGQAEGTGLAYIGVGVKAKVVAASTGVVGFGSSTTIGGVGVYAEGFRVGRGGGIGAYLNISGIGASK